MARDYSPEINEHVETLLKLCNAMEEGGNLKFRPTIEMRREIHRALAAQGMSEQEISEKTGVHKSTVHRDLVQNEPKNADKPEEKQVTPVQSEPTPATKTRQANEQKRKDELAAPIDAKLGYGLHIGDFRQIAHRIEDNSVQLVFTDPPYDKNAVELYRDAAAVAARILKPGGSFIAYSGQRHLPDVLKACGQYLDYWWTIAGIHSGGNQILNRLGIRCGWKPLVWFVKSTRGDVQNILLDTVTGDREKDTHEWQQSEQEARYYIEKLTTPDGIVVDFFIGGGTTAAAAKALGRNWIGFEVDLASAERASKRLEAA